MARRRPVDAEDFHTLVTRWFCTNDVDELDQLSFVAVQVGRLLQAEPELRVRFSEMLIGMIRIANDPKFINAISKRTDH